MTNLVHSELLRLISAAINDHPRSQQIRIGPSEVGIECERRLGYKVLGEKEREQAPSWRPTVGTAVHAWLETHVPQQETHLELLTETRVTVGTTQTLGDITGTADLFDVTTGTVIDYKIPSITTINDARRTSPAAQYITQAHLYGAGFINAGHKVNDVAIFYLPASGELTNNYYWSAPHDPRAAETALQRLERIAKRAQELGDAHPLPTATSHCEECPYRAPGLCDGDPNYKPRFIPITPKPMRDLTKPR